MTEGPERPRLRYLTVAEIAETMRVSKMTVYRLARSGDLPAVRVGRSYRVPQDALDAFLASSSAHLLTDATETAEDGAAAGEGTERPGAAAGRLSG